MKAEVQTCKFVAATDIVPRSWRTWFWVAISQYTPFTWGGNDHSMVDMRTFADHCEAQLDNSLKVVRWLEKIRKMDDDVYIDLES